MKLLMIYRFDSEHARQVSEFKEMMRRRYPDKQIEEFDINTKEGATKATLYGAIKYPALVVLSAQGGVLNMWEGEQIPLMDEVVSYMLADPSDSV